jgi:hypothetical protein
MPDDAGPGITGSGIDQTTPHSARIWNYWLGGKDNFEVDRQAGDAYAATFPGIVTIARESRRFLGRVVTYLAGEAGIRQFLDIGTGLPIADNTHEVAQRVAPDARVVYVDNDPLVLAHARALLKPSGGTGTTHYLHEDMHKPDELLAKAAEVLDLTQPVAVMFMGVLGHVPHVEDARRMVRVVLDAVPSGSYLALYDGSAARDAETFQQAQDDYDETGAAPYVLRSPAEIESLFDGLKWVPPGFVSLPLWRPLDTDLQRIGRAPEPIDAFGGVGRKR